MKKNLLILALLALSNLAYSQCIKGPVTINLNQTVVFTSVNVAQCTTCYDWDINNDAGSSDNATVGTLHIVGTDINQTVSITGVSVGPFTIDLTYFTEKECRTCTITGTVINPVPPGCWSDVSSGGGQTSAVKTNGTLWTWGLNNQGQLGDGTYIDSYVPIQIGTDTNWSKVSAANHTVALKTNGTLWAWGDNNFGQLGDGTNIDRNTPIQIGTDTNWSKISAGMGNTVALKTNGTLWVWGSNNTGQVGDGTTVNKNVPVQIGTDTNWSKILSVHGHTVALKTDGTLWAWGWNVYGQLGDGTTSNKLIPTQIGTANNWKEVGATWYSTAAIKTDGTLWAWGDNLVGELGDGTNISKIIPTQVGVDTNWKALSKPGDFHTIALKTNGTLWAWGPNHEWWSGGNIGQLGDGTYIDRNSPVQVGTGTNWSIISAGGVNSSAVKTDGTLWTWGFGVWGQLGNGATTDSNIPISVSCSVVPPPTPKMSINQSNLTVDPIKSIDLRLYPNPTSDIINVEVDNDKIIDITLLDVNARFINKFKVDNNKTQIDLSKEKQGIYFLEIKTNKGEKKAKVIKK